MRFITTILVFLLITMNAFSQQGKVEGKVTDSKSGNPVIGVSVLVDGSKTGIATDMEGRFLLSLLPGKKYTIRLSLIGYKLKELTEVEVNASSTTSLDIIQLLF